MTAKVCQLTLVKRNVDTKGKAESDAFEQPKHPQKSSMFVFISVGFPLAT
jgi:hypothetical protein